MMPRRCFQIFATGLFVLLVSMSGKSWGVAFWESYVPPEAIHARHLNQRQVFSGRVNVNHASLEELKTLPGVDNNIGLKLIRLRPFQSVNDLHRLPAEPKTIQQLIGKIQSLIVF